MRGRRGIKQNRRGTPGAGRNGAQGPAPAQATVVLDAVAAVICQPGSNDLADRLMGMGHALGRRCSQTAGQAQLPPHLWCWPRPVAAASVLLSKPCCHPCWACRWEEGVASALYAAAPSADAALQTGGSSGGIGGAATAEPSTQVGLAGSLPHKVARSISSPSTPACAVASSSS